jgi:hypothetical protein
MRIHRFGGAVVILSLLACGASAETLAQAPEAVRGLAVQVPEWLQSGDPQRVAWGAYLAAQYRMSSAVPLIEAALDRTDVTGGGCASSQCQSPAVVFALLDALVQLDAPVDPVRVGRFLPRWPVQSLVLLGRAGADRDRTLLPFFEGASGLSWRAAANLLLETRSSGFAVSLLRPVHLRLEVHVLDRSNRVGLSGSVVGGVTEGCNVVGGAPGFPPIAEYLHDPSGRGGATLLADGPRPAFYRRRVGQPGLVPCSSLEARSGSPTVQERIDYAIALARPLEMSRIYATTIEHVVWTDAEALRTRVGQARRNLEGRYRSMIGSLVAQGRLTAAEAKTLPTAIDLSVIDQRDNQSAPLPALE